MNPRAAAIEEVLLAAIRAMPLEQRQKVHARIGARIRTMSLTDVFKDLPDEVLDAVENNLLRLGTEIEKTTITGN